MSEKFLVGDIIRPSREAVKNRTHPYRGSFSAGRPAIILHRVDGYYYDSGAAIIAYKLKTGEWKEERHRVNLDFFEFVMRPENSEELNPFHNYKRFEKRRHLTICLNRKFFYIRVWLGGGGITDPDVPFLSGDRPLDPSFLGKQIRIAFSQINDCNHLRCNGILPDKLSAEINRKSSDNIQKSVERLMSKYNISKKNLLENNKELEIWQLYDCYVIRKIGYHFTESDEYISLHASDECLGLAVIKIFDMRRFSEKYFRTNNSYMSRVLPLIDSKILDIDF